MTCTDPTAEMLTQIRNALRAGKQEVEIPASRFKLEILRVLKEEGYLSDYKVSDEGSRQVARVGLKYGEGDAAVISGIELVSRPSLRVYSGWRKMPRVKGGLGIAIVSTSQGVMTAEGARDKKMGGEVLCRVW